MALCKALQEKRKQRYDPLKDPHPIWAYADTSFPCVRLNSLNYFVGDTEYGDLVPAFLHACFRQITDLHIQRIKCDRKSSFLLNTAAMQKLMRPQDPLVTFMWQSASFEDAQAQASVRPVIDLIQCVRTILAETTPPLLYLDYEACDDFNKCNVVYPIGMNIETATRGILPKCRECAPPMTNMVLVDHFRSMQMACLSSHLVRALFSITTNCHLTVTRYVFYHLSCLIRQLANVNRVMDNDMKLCGSYVARSVSENDDMHQAVINLATLFADVCICLDPRWVATQVAKGRYLCIENLEKELKLRVMMNILCTNELSVWKRGTSLNDLKLDAMSTAVIQKFKADNIAMCRSVQ